MYIDTARFMDTDVEIDIGSDIGSDTERDVVIDKVINLSTGVWLVQRMIRPRKARVVMSCKTEYPI